MEDVLLHQEDHSSDPEMHGYRRVPILVLESLTRETDQTRERATASELIGTTCVLGRQMKTLDIVDIADSEISTRVAVLRKQTRQDIYQDQELHHDVV